MVPLAVPEKIFGLALILDFFDRSAINRLACSATGSASRFIPIRSLKPNLKQICIGNLAVGILIICIIGEAQAIRFFVAKVLPRNKYIIIIYYPKSKCLFHDKT